MRPICTCHGLPMSSKGKGKWRCRLAQRRRTEKWKQTEGGRESSRRTDARRNPEKNPRRVFGASGYAGLAPRAEQAEALNQMVRDRRAQLKESACS